MKQDTFQIGEYAISTLATTDYVTLIDVPTLITSKYGVLKSDTVTYVADGEAIPDISGVSSEIVPAILLARNGEFSETITVGRSNAVYASYGSGNKPKIYGSEVITGWTVHSGNIYKASFATDITQLFVDGEKMQVARLTNSGYNLITGVTSQTVITTNAASQADNYYVGCKVITRTENWYSEIHTVTASTGNTITLDIAPSSTFNVGEGVLIMNKLEFLDSPGEWYYDTVTNTVYLWTPDGDSPTGYEVRGSTIDNGVLVTAKSHVLINNLNILHQKNAGVRITGSNSDNIKVENCVIDGQDNYGIYTESDPCVNHEYLHNTISNINGEGIWGYHIGASTISGNIISNIGLFEDWGIGELAYTGGGNGISLSTGNSTGTNTIEYNRLDNIGYNGIMWRGIANIQYNSILNSGLTKSDGGAIYTGSGTSSGSVVRYNIIDNVTGNMEGGITSRNLGEGIYLDENSIDITVEYNTVIGCSNSGIFAHKPNGHTISNNKIIDSRYGFLYTNTSTGTTAFENNFIVTGKATDDYEPRQLLVRETTTGVTLNNNIYVNGFASDNVFRITDGSYVDFAAWKVATSDDELSSYIGTDLAENETQRLVYNNSKTEQTFYLNGATSVKDENGTTITTSFTVAPFESKYIRGVNIDCILDYSDAVAPTITAFTIPDTVDNFIIPIITFTATGNATAYKITESATAPNLTDAGWSSTIPTTYTTGSEGTKTLYAWVRDAAGNISTSATDNIVVTVYFDLLANIVSWHEANSASGTELIDSKGGSSGTLYAGATIDQTGSLGEAILFDGTDDYAYIPRNTSIFAAGMPEDFSVLFRFKPSTIDATSRRIFEVSYGTTDFFNISNNSSNVIVTMAKNNSRRAFNTASSLSTSNWYVIVATWDATTETFKAYLNGTLITNSTANIGVNGGHASMAIGRKLLEPTYTNMLFETLGVFDKVLSQDEVNWLQNKEFSDL